MTSATDDGDADRDMSDRIRGELARRRRVLADRVFGPVDDPDDLGPRAA